MKKIFFIFCFVLFFGILSADAEVFSHRIYAVSNNNVARENLNKNGVVDFQAIDTCKIGDEDYIEMFSSLNLRIDKRVKAKRGKRDEYLKVTLLSYTVPTEDGKVVDVAHKGFAGTLKVTEEKDYKNIIASVGFGVAGKALSVPFLSQAAAVSKGLIKPNEDQTRLESAGKNLYESTPLTYAEMGKELSIQENTIVLIKLKSQNGKELKNAE